jgi:hypothetical protein
MNKITSSLNHIFRFYYEGFRSMPEWGKKAWIIIIIKIFIMFAILKIFFFPDILKTKFDNDKQRSEYVLDRLTNSPAAHD